MVHRLLPLQENGNTVFATVLKMGFLTATVTVTSLSLIVISVGIPPETVFIMAMIYT